MASMPHRVYLYLVASLGLGLGLTAAACTAEESTQQCIEDFGREQGYGFQSDDGVLDCPQPLEGEPIECPPGTPANIEQLCTDDGQSCDGSVFITRDAASCIAALEGLRPGIYEGRWGSSLVYDYELQRPVWQVFNVLFADACAEDGEVMSIDAETGANLGVGTWSLFCEG